MENVIKRVDNKTEEENKSSSILNMDYFINNDSLNLGNIEEVKDKPAKKRDRKSVV